MGHMLDSFSQELAALLDHGPPHPYGCLCNACCSYRSSKLVWPVTAPTDRFHETLPIALRLLPFVGEYTGRSPAVQDLIESVWCAITKLEEADEERPPRTGPSDDGGFPMPYFPDPSSSGKDANLPFEGIACLLYTSPSPRDQRGSRMPSSA